MREDVDQARCGRKTEHFIPMIESRFQRPLSSDYRNERADNAGHPCQHSEASGKVNATECGTADEDDRSQGKPDQHPTRSKLRQMVGLSHGPILIAKRRPDQAKLSQQRGMYSASGLPEVSGTLVLLKDAVIC